METIEDLQSQLNRAKAQLDQLCTSYHFTERDVQDLAPQMALKIRTLQKQYNHAITTGAKNTEVAEALPVT
ncbi:hypothetical protein [Aquimarina algiphila]|uniref:Uncharacterized protein n=2 Tax=Aquimarina algiphila TaxID=2047982 RepID=A0A554VE29_9FLAO|nr:hypothetical protein [Aquimarina algiphila]TSE05216.1 hypothetical protein FOF46_23420 [Aquimarina algiphila]